MILSGLEIVTRNLVWNSKNVEQQQQPCGVDLTLRQISQWTSAATLDFDNSKRQAAKTAPLSSGESDQCFVLVPGAYLVDVNEVVKVPLDCVATVFPRSSLWRIGVTITAGIVDAGYEGAMGALLEVKNPHGVTLGKDAKILQVVFEQMTSIVEGYSEDVDFVDPEVGSMARAAIHNSIKFDYLHIISDNVAKKYADDLSNERDRSVLTERILLYDLIQKVLQHQLLADPADYDSKNDMVLVKGNGKV